MRDTLKDHADRHRWNRKYREILTPSWMPSALFSALPHDALPAGDALELACGASGTALELARRGRRVTAADISDAALALLADRAREEGLGERIRTLLADLTCWRPARQDFALVICSAYWNSGVFRQAARAVMPAGFIAWEAFSLAHLNYRPDFPRAYCMAAGEPERLLPPGFTPVLTEELDTGTRVTRRLIARRTEA